MISGNFLVSLLLKGQVLVLDGEQGSLIVVELFVQELDLFEKMGYELRIKNVLFFGWGFLSNFFQNLRFLEFGFFGIVEFFP